VVRSSQDGYAGICSRDLLVEKMVCQGEVPFPEAGSLVFRHPSS